jgi:hypothetical protein
MNGEPETEAPPQLLKRADMGSSMLNPYEESTGLVQN